MVSASLLLGLLALVGGTVHVTAPGAAPLRATVLIEDGRIRAVGADLKVPEGAEVIDCTGLHLVPGLIDGLAYHDREHDTLYTASGVTLVRDHGNELGQIFAEAAPEVRDAAGGPSLSICGALLDGSPPTTGAAIVLRDRNEAERLLPALLKEHPDFLSVGVGLSADAWRGVLEAAHPADGPRLQVWGPVPAELRLDAILDGGQDGLLFLDGLVPKSGSWEDTEGLQRVVERVATSGIAVTPLLRGNARLLEDPGEDPPDLVWLGPQFSRLWQADLAARRRNLDDPEFLARGRAVLAAQRDVVARLHAAGVPLVPGSGAPHPWLMPGRGLVQELQEWQRAGLAPDELLELATVRSARALGLGDERGALAPGLVADVVGLAADPAEDVANLETVRLVVLRGTPLPRETLDARLEGLRAALVLARERAALPIEVPPPDAPEGARILSGCTESAVAGGRVSSERWVVVRELDDSLSFVGRRIMPPQATRAGLEVDTTQRVAKGHLEGFEVRVVGGEHEIVVRGMRVAGQWRIERRVDGAHVDTRAAREQLAAVDTGSVTTWMLLAQFQAPGRFPVLRFDEALELEVVPWELALDGEGGHAFKTPAGLVFVGFDEIGAPQAVVEQRGNGAITTRSLEATASGGPGLPIPERPATPAPQAGAASEPPDRG